MLNAARRLTRHMERPRGDLERLMSPKHYVFQCASDAQGGGRKLRVGREEAARRPRGGCKEAAVVECPESQARLAGS